MTHVAVPGPDWAMVSVFGWTSIVLSILLIGAVIALIVVLIRFLLHYMRHADAHAARHSAEATPYPIRQPQREFVSTRTVSNTVAPVTPDHPHAPPTPPVGTRRVRNPRP